MTETKIAERDMTDGMDGQIDEMTDENVERWEVRWSGGGWSLCSGIWELFHDGQKVETKIPFQGEPAYTHGTYAMWTFGGDSGWDEEWDEYEDGEGCDEWCDENREWLATFAPEDEWEEIFLAFQAEDFRPGSCGGCI